MIDPIHPIFVYAGALSVLFFFWLYGVVAFVRDVKDELVPWLLASTRGIAKEERDESADGTERERRSY